MATQEEGGTLQYYKTPRYEAAEGEEYQTVEREKPKKEFQPSDDNVYSGSISIDDCIAMFKLSENKNK